MSRNRYLDFLKGILIIAVVTGHVVQFVYYKDDQRYFGDIIFKSIYMWHMPLFMAVAGFLSWSGIKRDSFGRLAWLRFKSYLVPVFAWPVLFTCVRLFVQPKIVPSEWLNEVTHGSFGDFWFLWAIYLSILLASFCRLAASWYKAAYVVVPLLFLLLPDVWHLSLIKYVMPFFMLGCLVAEDGFPTFVMQNRLGFLIGSLVVAVICYWAWNDQTYVYLSGSEIRPSNSVNMILRYTAGLAGSVAVLLVVGGLFQALPNYVSAGIEALGRNSIYIYLLHGYVFLAAKHHLSEVSIPHLNVFLRAGNAVGTALVICGVLWAFCAFIARSEVLAQVFFGKWKAPSPTRATPPPRVSHRPFVINQFDR